MRYGWIFAAALTLPGVAIAENHGEQDTCSAAGFMGMIGQTGELAEMLELDQPIRVIPPNSAVTSDFLPNRINFALDEDGRIIAITCG